MLHPVQFDTPIRLTRAQQQRRQKGETTKVRLEGEETPRRVWTGHPSDRPEGWLQAELPK